MPKGYWVTTYRSVRDPDARVQQRVVIFEFDSAEQAIAAHDTPAYQEALRVLGNAVDRDLRIVPGA